MKSWEVFLPTYEVVTPNNKVLVYDRRSGKKTTGNIVNVSIESYVSFLFVVVEM